MTITSSPTSSTLISQGAFVDALARACTGYYFIDLPAQSMSGRRYLEFGAILICLYDTRVEAGYGPLVESIGRGCYAYTEADTVALASDLKQALATASAYGVTPLGERGFATIVLEIVGSYAGDDVPLAFIMRALRACFTPTLRDGRYGRRNFGFDLVRVESLLRSRDLSFVPFYACVEAGTVGDNDEIWLPVGWTTTLGKNFGALRKGARYQGGAFVSATKTMNAVYSATAL